MAHQPVTESDYWQFIYNDSNTDIDANGYLRPCAIVRKSDGHKFTPGDNVLIESGDDTRPFVGKIQDFGYNPGAPADPAAGALEELPFMEMSTIWFSGFEDVPEEVRRADYIKVSTKPRNFIKTLC